MEASLKFFRIFFVVFEILAEFALVAIDAVDRRFADGVLRCKRGAIGVFAGFADGFAGLFIGFASESRGNLESVEQDTGVAAINAVGAEATKDLVEGDLNAAGVFDGWKEERLGRGSTSSGVAAGGGVEVAEGLSPGERRLCTCTR